MLGDSPCRYCPFTSDFVKRYPTPEALGGEDARGALLGVAVLARRETTRVECRFAAIRRSNMIRSLTHKQSFGCASSLFVLRRQRIIESGWAQQAQRHGTRDDHQGGTQASASIGRPKRGGGGPFRAFVHEKFGGQKFAPEAMRQACEEYHEIEDEGGPRWARLVEIGRAATESHRHTGERSFGARQGAMPSVQAALARVYCADPDLDPQVVAADLAVVVGQHDGLQAALQEVQAESKARSCAESLARREQLHAITSWSEAQAAQSPIEPPTLASHAHIEPLPSSLGLARVLDMRPPAIQVMRRMAEHGVGNAFRSDWKDAHRLLRHADVPKLPVVKSRASRCWSAARCLCSPDGRLADAIHKGLVKLMREWCAKGKSLHGTLKSGDLVLELRNSSNVRVWAECAYFNLSSWEISFMRLMEVEDEALVRSAHALGLVILQVNICDETLGLQSGIDLCAALSPHSSWRVKAWEIVRGTAPDDPELPMYVFVRPTAARHEWFWSGDRRQPRARPRAQPTGDAGGVGPQALEDAPLEQAEADEPDEADDHADDAIFEMAMEGDSASDDSIWRDWAEPESEPEDADLELEPELGGEVAAAPDPPAAAGPGGPPLPPAPAAPAEPAAPSPPPPPAQPRPRPAAAGGGAAWVGPWWRYTFPNGIGFLVHNHNANSLDAHCPRHPQCRTNRSLGDRASRPSLGRPVGQLTAWLLGAEMYASKAEHKAALRDEIRTCSLRARQNAREWASGLEGFDQVLALERPQRPGEYAEPVGLPG